MIWQCCDKFDGFSLSRSNILRLAMLKVGVSSLVEEKLLVFLNGMQSNILRFAM